MLPPAQSALGRRRELRVEVLRSLESGDLETLLAANAAPQSGEQRIQRLRTSHHRLAELLASGSTPAEAGVITGYSGAYISILQNDPSFQELLEYYRAQRRTAFADLQAQIADYASDIVGELQERLATAPESFSLPELRAQLEVLAKASATAKGVPGSGPSAPPVSFKVEFITPVAPSGVTIEGHAAAQPLELE